MYDHILYHFLSIMDIILVLFIIFSETVNVKNTGIILEMLA